MQESVRTAAVTLANSMRSLTLRLTDKALTPASQASAAIAVALPLLIQQGSHIAHCSALLASFVKHHYWNICFPT